MQRQEERLKGSGRPFSLIPPPYDKMSKLKEGDTVRMRSKARRLGEDRTMIWSEIRTAYPEQWLVIEALEAYTTADNQRQLERIGVIETCSDSSSAMQTYRRLHQIYPTREFYFVHTSREVLDIRERQWIGIRSNRNAVNAN